jgi:hypothetical protein
VLACSHHYLQGMVKFRLLQARCIALAAIYYRCSNHVGMARRPIACRNAANPGLYIAPTALALAKMRSQGWDRVFKLFIKFSSTLSKNLTAFPTTASILSARF